MDPTSDLDEKTRAPGAAARGNSFVSPFLSGLHLATNARGLPADGPGPCDVLAFLERHIPESTVRLDPRAYLGAVRWCVAYGADRRVLGFSALRVLPADPLCLPVLVMGTFVAPELRSRGLGSTLVQAPLFGEIAAELLRADLMLPVYICTRTRNPSVYRACRRRLEVLPRLDDPALNRRCHPLALTLARRFFGPQPVQRRTATGTFDQRAVRPADHQSAGPVHQRSA